MVRLPAALLLPLALLALAGCSGDPGPAASGAGDQAVPAPASAGPATPSLVDEEGQPVPVREEPLQVAGRSAAGACAGASGAAAQCFNDLGDGNLQPLGAGALAVRGTLTWTAASPATETMSVIVLFPCGDGCWTGTADSSSVVGTSPLAVEFDLVGLDGRVALWFSSYQGASEAGAWAGVSAPQEFAFEGTVTVPE